MNAHRALQKAWEHSCELGKRQTSIHHTENCGSEQMIFSTDPGLGEDRRGWSTQASIPASLGSSCLWSRKGNSYLVFLDVFFSWEVTNRLPSSELHPFLYSELAISASTACPFLYQNSPS